jgi:hypothetical protein
MALYTVLEPPDRKPEKVAFIPEGAAWGGFILTYLWAAWHRMWVVAAVLLALSAVLAVAVSLEVLNPWIGLVVQFGIALIFALEARQLQVMALERAGYRNAGLIEASCLEAAEVSYFATRSLPAAPPAPARFRAAPEDTLGIFGNV